MSPPPMNNQVAYGGTSFEPTVRYKNAAATVIMHMPVNRHNHPNAYITECSLGDCCSGDAYSI
jgi:hypothetical protein